MSEVQLTGTLKINSVDVSDSVSSIVIKRMRNTISIPATLGNFREYDKAGSVKETIELNFFSDLSSTSLWAELYDAIDTDTAELTFEGTLDNGVVSADNPKFAGSFIVLGVDTGGTVGQLRSQSQTYPVTQAGITKTIAP